MPLKNKIPIQVSRRFDLPAEKIFDAFLDAQKAGKFMFKTETGKMIRAEVDPKVGGKFVFIEKRPSGEAEHYGTFLEIDRPKRLRFEFAVDKNAKQGDPVKIELAPKGKTCLVTLTHDVDAEYSDYRDRIAEGWSGILAGVAATVL